jgi:hypothetical protein
MLEKIAKKSRMGLATAGIAGLASLVGAGCAHLSEGELLTLAGTVMTQSGNSKAVVPGVVMSTIGQMKYQEEVRKRGYNVNVNLSAAEQENIRSTLPENVDVSNNKFTPAEGYVWVDEKDPRNLNVRKAQSWFIACEDVQDFDRSGQIDHPLEFIGKKRIFREGDKMTLAMITEEYGESEKRVEIYGPNRSLIYDASAITPKVLGIRHIGEDGTDFLSRWLASEGGYGDFRAIWYKKGELVGTNVFKIIQ